MKVYRNKEGLLHREDGPALIRADGLQCWVIDGKYHREDGPAIIYADGSQRWYINGRLHREDGLPHVLNKSKNTMTLSSGEVVSMTNDDYEKYRYKSTGRFTKAALREN